MESSKQISADLKSVLLEKHLNFEFLNTYKGVPFINRVVLQQVEEGEACFSLYSASSFAWGIGDNTLILSEGLLEPIEAHLVAFDRKTKTLRLSHFAYAGSRLSNRKELRVEPDEGMEVFLKINGGSMTARLADLSMRGAGIRLSEDLPAIFSLGKNLELYLPLADGEVRLSGRIRNVSRSAEAVRLSVEFLGAKPDKTLIVRYIMRRRAEIIAEMQQKVSEINPI